LRDYRAVAAPWSFEVSAITQPVTIWAPDKDQIVPLHLAEHLAEGLSNCEVVTVAGEHDWLLMNWDTVLQRLSA